MLQILRFSENVIPEISCDSRKVPCLHRILLTRPIFRNGPVYLNNVIQFLSTVILLQFQKSPPTRVQGSTHQWRIHDFLNEFTIS